MKYANLNEINFDKIEDKESILIQYLNTFKHINIIENNFNNIKYPTLTILDRTRNIFGYLFIINEDENIDIISQIKISYSELDRPVFYIIFNKNNEIKCTSSEIIHSSLIKDNNNSSTYSINHLNDFFNINELVKIIKKYIK